MGRPQARNAHTAKNKGKHKILKTKHFSKHPDQVWEGLKNEEANPSQQLPIEESLPGLGQFFCIHCTRYFINQKAKDEHLKTKDHKKKIKTLKEKPYDLKEAAVLNRY